MAGLRTETGTKILCKTSYLSEEIVLASRFSQNAVLLRKEKINIGSYGQEDLDKVKKESEESYEVEERDRVASRKLKPEENLKEVDKKNSLPSRHQDECDQEEVEDSYQLTTS